MKTNDTSVAEDYLSDALDTFRSYKRLAEKALAQVRNEEFFKSDSPASNSVAVIVKHIAGNQRSRWRNFLEEDGEKPDRKRDTEFEHFGESRDELMDFWESGWAALFETLEGLSEDDLRRTVTIRGEPHTVVQAINRQLTHYAYHIGQIALLAKSFRGADWKSLSVPRNRSEEFNEYISKRIEAGIQKEGPIEGPGEFASLVAEKPPERES